MASAPSAQRLPQPAILAGVAEPDGFDGPDSFDVLNSFAAPTGLDPQLERFLHQASSLLCQWLAQAEAGPPLPA
ncbi:MAG: hypothetical protein WCH37_12285, partial [Synechococcaceae cyanobacterium ELA182]